MSAKPQPADLSLTLPAVIYLPDLSGSKPHSVKRRRVADPKDCVVAFRCTPGEFELIRASAEKAGLDIGPYLRQRETGKAEPRRPGRSADASLLAKVMAQMGKSGSNLNQIARRLNSDEFIERSELREVISDHRATCEAIMRALGV